jgi:Tol biopolymer transport system component
MNRAPHQDIPCGNQIESALARLGASPEFASSEQLRRLLTFLVTQTLAGRQEELKESVIGVEVFGRHPGYDPKLDGIVRTEARRLRLKLADYYEGSGRADRIVFALPKGAYVPEFRERADASPGADAPGPSEPAPPPPPIGRHVARSMWMLAPAVMALAVLGFAISRARLQPPAPRVPRLLNLGLPFVRVPVFSPDGSRLLFSVDEGGQSHIWIHDLKTHANRQITSGDVRDYVPCWSPGGDRIAFLRRATVQKTDVVIQDLESGRARTITAVAKVLPLEWSRDGRRLAVSDETVPSGPLAVFLINAETGARRQITSPPAGMWDAEPRFSWSGGKLAFVRSLSDSVFDVYLQPLTPSLDPDGEPVRLTSDKQDIRGFAWSADDKSVIASMKRNRLTRSLWRVPLDGSPPEHLPESGIEPLNPSVSPAASQLAYVNIVADTNIWRAGHPERPLIESNRRDSAPQISPDGRWIVFRSSRSGSDAIWLAHRDGSGARMLADCGGAVCGSARWAPDSKRIAFDSRQAGSADIFLMSIEGREPVRFTDAPQNEVVPNWSHDGRSIYYASNGAGAWQIWRKPVAGGPAEQITRGGGFASAEDAAGRYLYFSRPDKGIWRIPLTGGEEEQVIPTLREAMWGSWALVPSGIYLIDYDPVTAGGPGQIEFFDFASGARRPVAQTGRMPVMWDLSLAVSPDGSELFYSQLDRMQSDLYLIDNFR